MMKKRVVISAVSFVEGGPLTVLVSCLKSAIQVFDDDWEIYALVHDKNLFDFSGVNFIEFPEAKRSWVKRLIHEWLIFSYWSQDFKPDLWLSLHDITPRVNVRRQSVYCHNPSPFYSLTLRDAILDPKFAIFCLLYKFVYRIRIKKNHSVVVQQDWIRREFSKSFGHENIMVAYPSTGLSGLLAKDDNCALVAARKMDGPLVFFYPALPRTFKNFEVLCSAMSQLSPDVKDKIEIRITIDGSENRYAKYIFKRYSSFPGVKFIGRQTREQMLGQYAACTAVLFPSKLETWGLPISEAKELGIPVLAADLPYAKETVGDYELVSFLPPDDSMAWSDAINSIVKGDYAFQGNSRCEPDAPFAKNWHEFWNFLKLGL